jgi:hypothetical protein
MDLINAEDLKEEMVVAEDVKDKNGQLLLPAGLTLTSKHLEVIKSWGIAQVAIEDGKKEEEVPLDPAIIAKAEGELTPVFRYVDRKHPVMNELFTQCVTRRAKQLSTRG